MTKVNVFANKMIKQYYGSLDIENGKIVSPLNVEAIKKALSLDYEYFSGHLDNSVVNDDCQNLFDFFTNKNRANAYQNDDMSDVLNMLKNKTNPKWSDVVLGLKSFNHDSTKVDLNNLDYNNTDIDEVFNCYMTLLVNKKLLKDIKKQRSYDIELLSGTSHTRRAIANAKNSQDLNNILALINGFNVLGGLNNCLNQKYHVYFDLDKKQFVTGFLDSQKPCSLNHVKKLVLENLNDYMPRE